jgi:hypothetical protein
MTLRSTEAHLPSPSLVAMDAILTRVGHEISHLATTMDQFQSLVSPLVVAAGRQDRAFLREVQNFDHIAQKLSCLAEYLLVLASETSHDWMVDPNLASEVVTLAALSDRLSASSPTGTAESAIKEGECELF